VRNTASSNDSEAPRAQHKDARLDRTARDVARDTAQSHNTQAPQAQLQNSGSYRLAHNATSNAVLIGSEPASQRKVEDSAPPRSRCQEVPREVEYDWDATHVSNSQRQAPSATNEKYNETGFQQLQRGLAGAFLDLQSAFGSVTHSSLLRVLAHVGVHDDFYTFV